MVLAIKMSWDQYFCFSLKHFPHTYYGVIIGKKKTSDEQREKY